jgi:o-succinylbenzoate synthase
VKWTLDSRPFRLPLRTPLATVHGRLTAVEGLLLRVQDGHGGVGLGEVTPLPEFGTDTLEQAREALRSFQPPELPEEWSTVAGASRSAKRFFLAGALPTATRAGVEMALLDLLARRADVPLARWLGVRTLGPVLLNGLLRSEAPDALAREAADAVAAGFRTLKLKVGVGTEASDVARLRAVRDAVGPSVQLRIDANGAWDEAEARDRLGPLVSVGLEYVEQPVRAGDIAALRRLRSLVPIAADEALGCAEAASAILDGPAGPAADVLILKLPVLGGVLPALALARRAQDRGVDTVVTSAMDGAVGRAAAAHLACALGGTRAHGLATGALLVEDPGAYPVTRGTLVLPDRPGLGIAPEVLGW